MDVKHDDKMLANNRIHVLTKEDGEDVLVAIDSLYWSVLRLFTDRNIDVAHDPQELAHSMSRKRRGD